MEKSFVKNSCSLSRGFIDLILIILLIFTINYSLKSQGFDSWSNPQISVKLTHPPALGLKINKVIFNPVTGNCADQILSTLESDFVNNNIEVIDRENLQTILAEQDFNLSSYVDKNTALSIGKIIGPSAMITVKILRCNTEIKDKLYRDEKKYDYKSKSYYIARAYLARTKVYLKVSIQTVDLTTGRIFSAKIFDYSPQRENKSYSGAPEVPSKYEVQEIALNYLKNDMHKLFFSWTEHRNLYFMDDRKGGLKAAFKALKIGDMKQAFELSKKNVEYCQNTAGIKQKVLAHAYYNLGMMYFINNDFDSAIFFLKKSQKLRPGKIVNQSISTSIMAKRDAEKMKQVEQNATIESEKINEQKEKIKQSEISNTLTNEDIISLTKKKLPTKLIIHKIESSTCHFNTSTDELVKLSEAGVAEEVIMIMMDKK